MDIDPNLLRNEGLDSRLVESNPDQVGINVDQTVERTMKICLAIEKFNMTPKSFLSSFLMSSNPDIVSRRRLWISQTGWASTVNILDLVKGLSCKKDLSRKLWVSWVFNQAEEIVNSQKPPQRMKDLYVNASKVTHSLFERPDDHEHEDLEHYTPFIYKLILSKLKYSNKA